MNKSQKLYISEEELKEIQDKCDLEPLGNMVVAKEIKVEETIGGIIIPKDSIRSTEGVVVAVGPSCSRLQPGDRILWGTNIATQIPRDGINYVGMWESNVSFKIIAERSGNRYIRKVA